MIEFPATLLVLIPEGERETCQRMWRDNTSAELQQIVSASWHKIGEAAADYRAAVLSLDSAQQERDNALSSLQRQLNTQTNAIDHAIADGHEEPTA